MRERLKEIDKGKGEPDRGMQDAGGSSGCPKQGENWGYKVCLFAVWMNGSGRARDGRVCEVCEAKIVAASGAVFFFSLRRRWDRMRMGFGLLGAGDNGMEVEEWRQRRSDGTGVLGLPTSGGIPRTCYKAGRTQWLVPCVQLCRRAGHGNR